MLTRNHARRKSSNSDALRSQLNIRHSPFFKIKKSYQDNPARRKPPPPSPSKHLKKSIWISMSITTFPTWHTSRSHAPAYAACLLTKSGETAALPLAPVAVSPGLHERGFPRLLSCIAQPRHACSASSTTTSATYAQPSPRLDRIVALSTIGRRCRLRRLIPPARHSVFCRPGLTKKESELRHNKRDLGHECCWTRSSSQGAKFALNAVVGRVGGGKWVRYVNVQES
ncbi:uncharacterized protein J3D65DRAFT_336748 [Phyllosticta citribraziliensis]|uniref:Uncharacterized protein n=1 Tax=Phyllosticta citribraziliensis TaxID=989973 RepID=A0ABR1LTW6_9PEZI